MYPSLHRTEQLNSSIFLSYGIGWLRNPLNVWALLALRQKPRTFFELYWRSGWSDTKRNLLRTLQILEWESFIKRREAPQSDVFYALTPQGADLADLVSAMHDWVECCEIRSRRPRFAPASMHHQPARSREEPAGVASDRLEFVE